MKPVTCQSLHLIVLVAAGLSLGEPARAIDGTVEFGAPTVLSQQGQRLKVLVPVKSRHDDRASAASFLVRETEVPRGQRALSAQDFTIIRPASADYVVFQSGEPVDSPAVSLIVSIAGDPRSPYRMDLQVPPESADHFTAMTGTRPAAREFITRRIRGPVGRADLPPK